MAGLLLTRGGYAGLWAGSSGRKVAGFCQRKVSVNPENKGGWVSVVFSEYTLQKNFKKNMQIN